MASLIHPHQRCGYSDSPFARRDNFLYCRVQKGVGRGGHRWLALSKRKLSPGKRHFFVIEKYIGDVKQKEKDVPDLVESIMRPTDPAKEGLGGFCPKWVNLDSESKNLGFAPFRCRGESWISTGGCLQEQSRLCLDTFQPKSIVKRHPKPKKCGLWPEGQF